MLEGLLTCILVVVAAVAFYAGHVIKDYDWRVDCQKLEAHVAINGKAYDCKERK